MARPQAPCGTYSAYKRHRSKGEPVDEACENARNQRTKADAAARKADRAQQAAAKVAAAAAAAADDDLDDVWDDRDVILRVRSERSRHDDRDAEPKSRVEKLQWNLDLVEAAMQAVASSEPAKLAPLSKRHSELLDELRRIEGDEPVKDAFDEFFADAASNVVGISTATSRKPA